MAFNCNVLDIFLCSFYNTLIDYSNAFHLCVCIELYLLFEDYDAIHAVSSMPEFLLSKSVWYNIIITVLFQNC